MLLAQLKNICHAFGGPAILNGVSLQIHSRERICLLGRNGSGKSTLMKIINTEISPDNGNVSLAQGIRTSRLRQQVPSNMQGAVFELVAQGQPELGKLLWRFHELTAQVGGANQHKAMAELQRVQAEIDSKDAWSLKLRVDTVVSRLGLDPDVNFAQLSGGQKRRALLAQALVSKPDILLLDEPTNHLDIAAIEWLEQFILGLGCAILFVTHDRMLLQKLATRIIELDRGILSSWPGTYQQYTAKKEQQLHAEQQENARFDKKLAAEEVWVRQGIKARRTRNEGRLRFLLELRKTRQSRQDQQGQAKLTVNHTSYSGKLVVEADGIRFAYDGQAIVEDFSCLILRGDKIAIVGPNGCGKTTLLRLLLQQLSPHSGHLRLGTHLQPAYFDQHHSILQETQSIRDNVGGGSDFVTVDNKQRHIMSYLKDFLFAPDRVNTPVQSLSGGERNRVMLAKLLSQSSNLLVLDEPTNDLDVETLELLEHLLIQYSGTILLVSHDRTFVENVVSSTIAFQGNGKFIEYVGGYQDMLRQARLTAQTTASKTVKHKKSTHSVTPRKKLNFNEQRELRSLPKTIENLESEQSRVQETMQQADFFRQPASDITTTKNRLTEIGQLLEKLYERWEALEIIDKS